MGLACFHEEDGRIVGYDGPGLLREVTSIGPDVGAAFLVNVFHRHRLSSSGLVYALARYTTEDGDYRADCPKHVRDLVESTMRLVLS